MEIGFAVLALVLGLISYAFLTGRRTPAEGFPPQFVTLLLVANLVPLLGLLVLIGRRVARLMAHRRARVAGAQLHVRLIALFAGLTAIPTILTVVFASLLFQYGVQFWFSDRARTVLDNADQVARAYVDEARSRILDDIVAMGRDVSNYAVDYGLQSPAFREGLSFQVAARNLSEAAVFRTDHGRMQLVASAGMEGLSLPERLQSTTLSSIPAGRAVALTSARDRIEAVVRLQTAQPFYVYVSRKVEPRVLEQVARTRAALSDYKALTDRSRDLQWRFNVILLIVSLLIIASAVWFAILLASRLVAPIGELAQAAERVGTGDLNAEVVIEGAGDELGALGNAFNRMIAELRSRTAELIAANTQSEERRRFAEAILSGVSAGVLSIDMHGRIRLANQRAAALLDLGGDALVDQALVDAVPEFEPLFEAARSHGTASGEINRVAGPDARPQILAARLTADSGAPTNFILTFDDISQQIADQRRAAWADVARRIAHEIKNPLTPIVLSAERLKRRFGRQITEGRDVFEQLVDTIIRQVGDLRRMVDEFSAFARMPTAVFREEDLASIIRQTVFLAEVASPGIHFTVDIDPDLPGFVCDRRQLGQAFGNLVKNAVEAIGARPPRADDRIAVAVRADDDRLVVTIVDNGVGLPAELRERLFEPYVTTRERGTGLGLAIVKRIVEDHRGQLELSNQPGGGAIARLEFSLAAARALLPANQDQLSFPESSQVS